MKLNDLFPSNFLKKEDVPQPTVTVIKGVTQEEVAGDGGKELKAVIHFTHTLKPMILNKGNAETIATFYGDDTVGWVGKPVEIYHDPSVMFGSKRVGGIRIRQPQHGTAPQQHPSANGFGPVAAPAAGPFWDISDGKKVLVKKTTEEVLDFLTDADEMGVPMTAYKVRNCQTSAIEVGDAWWGTHAIAARAGVAEDIIPF